ncbi:segregation and condensation protein A [Peijinzhouia sedimentorum]
MSFEIKLPLFEGPFDLLLFFIERDELDIYDIPISKITADFLDYLKHLEKMNLEVASEFIFVAATLMRIKSKMLLPRPELDEEGNELDPREELIRHLLEYKRFKEVVGQFSSWEEEWLQKEKRGNIQKEILSIAGKTDVEAELQHVDMYKLLKVYKKVLDRYELEKNKPRHEVREFQYTIGEQRDFVMQMVSITGKIAFEDLITEMPDRIAIIFNFLAILDLLQQRLITLHLGEGFNNFWIEKLEEVPEEVE